MNNFNRMIQLAQEVFAAHNDPMQLDVDEHTIEQLKQLHPATVSEYVDGDGPVLWVIIIPTINALMHEFIDGKISETELLSKTPLHSQYDALYLCSAMVLDEFRKKGLATQYTLAAIQAIRKEHQIKDFFVWAFTAEGYALAESIAKQENLPLLKRERK